MFKKDNKTGGMEKVIDIDAGIQGSLKFSGPVNLRINGKFDGELEAQGVLIIGEKADVIAKIIKGENITITGKVKGDVESSGRLELSASAKVTGNIKAPILVVNEGAMLKGHCQVPIDVEKSESKESSKKKE